MIAAGFCPDTVLQFLERGRGRELSPGQDYLRQGQSVLSLAIVEEGGLIVTAEFRRGGAKTLTSLSEGAVTGWEALLVHRQSAFTISASAHTRLWEFSLADLQFLRAHRPRATTHLVESALCTMESVGNAARALTKGLNSGRGSAEEFPLPSPAEESADN